MPKSSTKKFTQYSVKDRSKAKFSGTSFGNGRNMTRTSLTNSKGKKVKVTSSNLQRMVGDKGMKNFLKSPGPSNVSPDSISTFPQRKAYTDNLYKVERVLKRKEKEKAKAAKPRGTTGNMQRAKKKK